MEDELNHVAQAEAVVFVDVVMPMKTSVARRAGSDSLSRRTAGRPEGDVDSSAGHDR